MFPKNILYYKKIKDDFDWWGFGITFPFIFIGDEWDLGNTSVIRKFSAPTEIQFNSCEYFHKFEIRVLGFGFWYAKQWGY